jgi:hypothetical protein
MRRIEQFAWIVREYSAAMHPLITRIPSQKKAERTAAGRVRPTEPFAETENRRYN